jgi:hypothetical protein
MTLKPYPAYKDSHAESLGEALTCRRSPRAGTIPSPASLYLYVSVINRYQV